MTLYLSPTKYLDMVDKTISKEEWKITMFYLWIQSYVKDMFNIILNDNAFEINNNFDL